MTRDALTLFNPTLRKPAAVDALKKLDPAVQRRGPLSSGVRVRRIGIAVLVIALVLAMLLIRVLHYMPASELGAVIEHLKFWK
jgi:tetrahydromethanopterin S-methyltransferase subunit F